jgi:pimeloyl-ACP methyl ester carboxylesterase
MKINKLEKVKINDSWQWVLVRGKNIDAPLLLHVQAGPGLPIIPEADTIEKLLHLEDHFLVAYWDQRGCGKSFDKSINPKTINISQLTDDVIECTRYLLKEYNKDKAILSGYSLGAALSLMAAKKERSIFSQLFLTGIDIDIPSANKYAVEFAMAKAREKNNTKLMKQAIKFDKQPITDTKLFRERAKLLTDLGGVNTSTSYNRLLMATIRNMLFSKSYSFMDILKTINGMKFCQNALLPEFDIFNLFDKINDVQVPVHFIQGKLDGVAPHYNAVKFYEHLHADNKTFAVFENSAHMPHYEEPQKFAKLLKDTIFK